MGYDDEAAVKKKYMEREFDKIEVEASTDSKLITILVFDTDENTGERLEFTFDEAIRLEKLVNGALSMLQADRPNGGFIPGRYRCFDER